MACQRALYQWTEVVTTPMSPLSKPHAGVVALWSLGMVLARSCALSAVSAFLVASLGRKPTPVRHQLREWCSEGCAKRSGPRQELKGESCLAPLLAGGLRWGEGHQLAVAVDATTLGPRFGVVVLSGRYRGCASPVAWTVVPATEKPGWRGEWLRRRRQGRAVVPRRFFVLVLADRGWSARWLFRRSVRWGWHPRLRINTGGTFRPAASAPDPPLRQLGPQPGTQWGGCGTACQGPRRRRNGTLLARWDAGYAAPWSVVTDLAPSAGEACGEGLRAGSAQGFKLPNRGGWPWQRTRLSDPQRAARLWVAVAVATVWLLSGGGMAEETIPESTLLPLAADGLPASRPRRATPLRWVSGCRRGGIASLVALLNPRLFPRGRFKPEPWPRATPEHPLRETIELPLAA
jgi:hypothetical protein